MGLPPAPCFHSFLSVPSKPYSSRLLVTTSKPRPTRYVVDRTLPTSQLSTTSTARPINFRSTYPTFINDEIGTVLKDYYTKYNASLQRGKCTYELGRLATEKLEQSRTELQSLLHECKDERGDGDTPKKRYEEGNHLQIIYANDSMNAMKLLADSLTQTFTSKDQVLIPWNCSDSTITSWYSATVHRNLPKPQFIKSSISKQQPQLEDFLPHLSSHFKVVVLSLFCPLTGSIVDLQNLIPFFRGIGVTTIIDISQHYGALSVSLLDLQNILHDLRVDFIIWGLQSVGAFIVGQSHLWESLPPVIGGERTFNECLLSSSASYPKLSLIHQQDNWAPIPYRFECETSVTPIALTITTAFKSIVKRNEKRENDYKLTDLTERLKSQLETLKETKNMNIELYMPCLDRIQEEMEDLKSMTISLILYGMNHERMVNKLNEEYGIVCNTGRNEGFVSSISQNIIPNDDCIRLYIDSNVHTLDDMDLFITCLSESYSSC